jgi:hypothetical protein
MYTKRIRDGTKDWENDKRGIVRLAGILNSVNEKVVMLRLVMGKPNEEFFALPDFAKQFLTPLPKNLDTFLRNQNARRVHAHV